MPNFRALKGSLRGIKVIQELGATAAAASFKKTRLSVFGFFSASIHLLIKQYQWS